MIYVYLDLQVYRNMRVPNEVNYKTYLKDVVECVYIYINKFYIVLILLYIRVYKNMYKNIINTYIINKDVFFLLCKLKERLYKNLT